MTHLQTLHAALTERRLLKVIAGITNFDRDRVRAIALAAAEGGAQAIDIACDAELIAMVKAETDLIVFVSSTEPAKLIAAAAAGAEVLELGNYDALYHQGIHPTQAEILGWARDVRDAVGTAVPLCVTVSGHLPLAEQLALATDLQAMGVEILQTEGQVGPQSGDTFSALSAAVSALGNTAEIRKVTHIPLLLAGGFTRVTAPFAIAAGADALGVGAAVTSLASHAEMVVEVRAIARSLDTIRTSGNGLAQV